MTRIHPWQSLAFAFTFLSLAAPVWAQSPPSNPPAAAASAAVQASDDDEETLQLAEPSFRTVNLPTTLRLPVHKANFELVHRFNGNLAKKSFGDNAGDLFGLDNGAAIGIEYRYAPVRHLQAIVYRTNIDKTFQFSGKYDAVHQGAAPLSISAVVAVEGTNNFQDDYAPSVGAVLGRTFGDVAAVYATPLWVHNSAALIGSTRDTGVVGLGARVRIRPTVYLTGEVSPRMSGYKPGKPEFGFALEKRAGLHVFQLNFTNTQASTFAQVARGGFPDSLYLGFNLARKFF